MIGLRIPPPEWLVAWLEKRALLRPIDPIYQVSDGKLYMLRYTLFRCSWLWVRLHVTLLSDADPHLHDHPWRNFSWILRTGYIEQLPKGLRLRKRGDMVFRGLRSRHRLDLYPHPTWIGEKQPCTSLFVTGSWRQVWGFFEDDGTKTPWREFLARKAARRGKDSTS